MAKLICFAEEGNVQYKLQLQHFFNYLDGI